MNQYRHGDILIEKIERLPKTAKVKKSNVIVSASHDHILEGQAKIYTFRGKNYLKVTGKANVDHEEHGKINLPVGVYKVIQQVEYDIYEGVRDVQD